MNYGFVAVILAWLSFGITSLAAWLTHVVVCLKAASWGFLIAGSILPPIGVIHGIGIWFGIF